MPCSLRSYFNSKTFTYVSTRLKIQKNENRNAELPYFAIREDKTWYGLPVTQKYVWENACAENAALYWDMKMVLQKIHLFEVCDDSN